MVLSAEQSSGRRSVTRMLNKLQEVSRDNDGKGRTSEARSTMASRRLHAWRGPAFRIWFLDGLIEHTWVTSHASGDVPEEASFADKFYWYCWGGKHTPGPRSALCDASADLDAACRICEPNAIEASPGLPYRNYTRATCHQVANRILYACADAEGNAPTVEGAGGYRFTTRLFDVYGDGWRKYKNMVLVDATTRSEVDAGG